VCVETGVKVAAADTRDALHSILHEGVYRHGILFVQKSFDLGVAWEAINRWRSIDLEAQQQGAESPVWLQLYDLAEKRLREWGEALKEVPSDRRETRGQGLRELGSGSAKG